MLKYFVLDEGAVRLFNEEHFSLQMIGDLYGVSRTAVRNYLNRRGVSTAKGRVYRVTCLYCGAEKIVSRKVYRDNKRHYCSRACYFSHIKVEGSKRSRSGMRRARTIVNAVFPLQEYNVVHHEDGDDRNNALYNLRVFKDQGDHNRYHRLQEGRPEPIFDGSVRYPRQGN